MSRKPKKSVKWADQNFQTPLQQIQFIDIVGKGKKLSKRHSNGNKSNQFQVNKSNFDVSQCLEPGCPYYGKYHFYLMRQTAV